MVDVWTFGYSVTQGGWALDVVGYRVEAIDGHVGEVDQASFDDGSSCLIVDTGFWIFGKRRMVPGGYVDRVDDATRTIYLSCTKDAVKNAPDYEAALHDDPEHRSAVSDAFAPSRYEGMTGDPIGPEKGPGRDS